MPKLFVMTWLFAALALPQLASQVVRPAVPVPSARANPPTAAGKSTTPKRSRRDILRRKNGSKPGSSTGTPAPGASGSPGAKKAKGSKKPSKRSTKLASQRLKMRRALLRSAHTETWTGEVIVRISKDKESKAKIKVELRRSRDGSLAQRFTYDRAGDLPKATRLVRRNPKGVQAWWAFRPEDRRVVSASAASRLADSALKFQDLLALDLNALRAQFIDQMVLDKKTVLVYRVAALATATEPEVRVYLRSDYGLISRIEYHDSAGKVKRQVLFSELHSYGVHKRWQKVVIHDHEGGRSATVKFSEIRINPTISDLRFLSDKLGD